MSIPYLGSQISLISKSGIRYEGILYTIDPKEGQVALQNVRSFGTEGRRQDGQEIPPSPTVYEYIIFRGSDIKDLQVCERPPVPPAGPPIPEDPAIVSSGVPPPRSGGPYGYPPPGGHHHGGYPPRGPHPGAPPYGYPHPHHPHGSHPSHAPPASRAPPSSGGAPPASQSGGAPNGPGAKDAGAAKEKTSESPASTTAPDTPSSHGKKSSDPAPNDRQSARPPAIPHHKGNSGDASSRAPSTTTVWGTPRPVGSPVSGSAPPAQSQRARPGARSRPTGKPRGRPSRLRQPRGTAPASASPKKMEEFDFEEANAKFDRAKVEQELATEDVADGDAPNEAEAVEEGKSTVYDKSSSFFDSLSCDSLDHTAGKGPSRKMSYSQQRRLDTETFGAGNVKQRRNAQRHHRRRNYRRNNYQPRRGGHRGGRGSTAT